ncbi:peptidyl-prolyl cis-trans isomerase FKBP1A isoform X1 [Pan paniscus]|uniref:peptidyl-prolyl cis-trans isomerase FKBP1A isoform X1 n=1 Tax=Pan paniscus TaxID=9597 RepID=UPI0024364CDE|nr:peptidyl-prolyl cis-trans isomerase FKBP1A isoform X1 [Pan paniscus]
MSNCVLLSGNLMTVTQSVTGGPPIITPILWAGRCLTGWKHRGRAGERSKSPGKHSCIRRPPGFRRSRGFWASGPSSGGLSFRDVRAVWGAHAGLGVRGRARAQATRRGTRQSRGTAARSLLVHAARRAARPLSVRRRHGSAGGNHLPRRRAHLPQARPDLRGALHRQGGKSLKRNLPSYTPKNPDDRLQRSIPSTFTFPRKRLATENSPPLSSFEMFPNCSPASLKLIKSNVLEDHFVSWLASTNPTLI